MFYFTCSSGFDFLYFVNVYVCIVPLEQDKSLVIPDLAYSSRGSGIQKLIKVEKYRIPTYRECSITKSTD